jgi:7-cyano-7-deazaguanine synthase
LNVIALSSGGVDSSVMMLLLKKNNVKVHPLHVDYGHRSEEREWASCKQVCKRLSLKPEKIDLSGVKMIPSALTNPKLNIIENAFLPTRNLLFITVAAAYGYGKGIYTVAIGLLSNAIFPDQTKRFVQSAESCLSKALGVEFRILAPLISLDKRDTLRLARKYRISLGLTYSCHAGGRSPCGRCIACLERTRAEKTL